jgi:hypothetical protein
MQIVKLAHTGKAALKHLDIGLRRDRFDVLRREPVQKPVHHLAPGPEIVVGGTPDFGQPRHAALEGMAVNIAQARDRDGMAFVAVGRSGVCLHP